jgi:signal transduction histidine kinase
MDKIFVPNFSTKSEGMGLGLAMVKNIVESFDGKIWFETAQNVGTSFYVSLPIKSTAK